MPEANDYCMAHSGQSGKLDLLIKLMVTSVAIMLFLVGLTVNLHITLARDLSSIDKRVITNSLRISELDRRIDQNLREK